MFTVLSSITYRDEYIERTTQTMILSHKHSFCRYLVPITIATGITTYIIEGREQEVIEGH